MRKIFFPPTEEIYDKKTEKKLIKEKKIIKKTKYFDSLYYPTKIEEWLEQMESIGLNFYRVGKLRNTFYFKKGEKRKVKYFTDLRHAVDEDYYELHTQSGWKLLFTSKLIWLTGVLWSKEYIEEDEVPEFYSSKEYPVRNSRKMAVSNSLIAMVIVCLFIRRIVLDIFMPISANLYIPTPTWLMSIFYFIIIIGFTSSSINTILYYLKIKKKYHDLEDN